MDTQKIYKEGSMTEEYEKRALRAFRIWYRENQPTIAAANEQAALIASNAVGSLTMLRVLVLLKEHPEWTHQPLPVSGSGDRQEITISGVARAHLIKHLEQTIQAKGLKAVYATN